MGLAWPEVAELIRRSVREARAEGGSVVCGAGTDQLAPPDVRRRPLGDRHPGRGEQPRRAVPPEQVGVIIDAYHVWWDPDLRAQVRRAAGRILGYHVSDWLVPPPDPLLGRGMMGDGVIDLRRLRGLVEAAGYRGPIEVEIFNREIWDAPGDDVLARIKSASLQHV